MDERKTQWEAHLDAISQGESIYIALAEEAGIDPVAAMKALPTILSASWRNREEFFADLGNNDYNKLFELLFKRTEAWKTDVNGI
jgi:hypothetical protein